MRMPQRRSQRSPGYRRSQRRWSRKRQLASVKARLDLQEAVALDLAQAVRVVLAVTQAMAVPSLPEATRTTSTCGLFQWPAAKESIQIKNAERAIRYLRILQKDRRQM